MSVRRQTWKNRDGSGEAWMVCYRDHAGARRFKNFKKKRDADAYHKEVWVNVRRGVHTADSTSITVTQAGEQWIEGAISAGLERGTIDGYRQHLDFHIAPLIGAARLSQLTIPAVRQFEDDLARGHSPAKVRRGGVVAVRKTPRSPTMVRKVMRSLGSILADAQERGQVAQNVVHGLRRNRRRDRTARVERRQRGKLKVGVHIPTPDETRRIIAALEDDRRRPMLLTAIFAGLRASELRGLPWPDVDLKKAEIHVTQRADRYQKIGPVKTEAGERTVPISPRLANTLREWKLVCPKSHLNLVFPSLTGTPQTLANIVRRSFQPAQIRAGVVDAKGWAKYKGLHALRHFYASWCINRKADGGLELPLKVVSARLGHASIQITADTYGHLFPSADDGSELAAAEKALWR